MTGPLGRYCIGVQAMAERGWERMQESLRNGRTRYIPRT
jgi:hypothetical protein